jgi:hypothetical protein
VYNTLQVTAAHSTVLTVLCTVFASMSHARRQCRTAHHGSTMQHSTCSVRQCVTCTAARHASIQHSAGDYSSARRAVTAAHSSVYTASNLPSLVLFCVHSVWCTPCKLANSPRIMLDLQHNVCSRATANSTHLRDGQPLLAVIVHKLRVLHQPAPYTLCPIFFPWRYAAFLSAILRSTCVVHAI